MKNEININPNLSTITFKCKYETSFGEELFIIGNIEKHGSPKRRFEWKRQKKFILCGLLQTLLYVL